jgi:N,N-dimethylformamidase
MRFERLGDIFSGTFASVDKPLLPGLFGRVSSVPAAGGVNGLTVGARIQPTAIARGKQCVMSQWNGEQGIGFALLVSERGVEVVLGAGANAPARRVLCAATLGASWYDIWVAVDVSSNRVEIGVAEVDRRAAAPLLCRHVAPLDAAFAARLKNCSGFVDLLIGALQQDGARSAFFNGKIEAPFVANMPPPATQTGAAPRAGSFASSDLYAAWDFARGIDTLEIVDTTSHAQHGTLINLPTQAVRGSRWSGREMCWRAAPDHYAAIHFHDDDLHDAGWSTDFTFTVPGALRSGAYAMKITLDDATDYLPFYVHPEPGKPTASIVFVAATYTYQTYANYARGNSRRKGRSRARITVCWMRRASSPGAGYSTASKGRCSANTVCRAAARPASSWTPPNPRTARRRRRRSSHAPKVTARRSARRSTHCCCTQRPAPAHPPIR